MTVIHLPKNAKASDEEKVKIAMEYANLIINNENIDEFLEEHNDYSKSTLDRFIISYLPRVPENYVDYKIYLSDVKPINDKEIKRLKEYISYVIIKIQLRLKILESEKAQLDNKTEINLRISSLKRFLRIYYNCLELLNYSDKAKLIDKDIASLPDEVKDII